MMYKKMKHLEMVEGSSQVPELINLLLHLLLETAFCVLLVAQPYHMPEEALSTLDLAHKMDHQLPKLKAKIIYG